MKKPTKDSRFSILRLHFSHTVTCGNSIISLAKERSGNELKAVANKHLRSQYQEPKMPLEVHTDNTNNSSSFHNLFTHRTKEKWASTSTPATGVSVALQEAATPGLGRLPSGIPVSKVTTRGKLYPRVVTVSSDCLALFCTHTTIASSGKNKASSAADGADPDTPTSTTPFLPSSLASRLPLPMITRKGIAGLTRDVREQYVRYLDVADLDFVCTGAVMSRKAEQANSTNDDAESIVTIGHHGDQTLDVRVKNPKELKNLVESVQCLIDTYRSASLLCGQEALLLRYIWYDVDANRDGTISESEFLKILSRINLCLSHPRRKYRSYCKQLAVRPSKGLQLDQVMAFLQTTKRQQGNPALMLFMKLFGAETKTVTASVLREKFLIGSQMETKATLADAEALVDKINSMDIESREMDYFDDEKGADHYITFGQFEAFLYHPDNAAYNPVALELPSEPLTAPMSQYFINTSHNTYLTGDQLQSASSVEMYDRALRRGCKCLELDCWDGDAKKKPKRTRKKNKNDLQPVVFHGHTLTSKILFGDILAVVENYLRDFPQSYPIILSLENHCSFPYQEAMAKLLTETFGDKLFIPEAGSTDAEDPLPSPESLRGRVVIKGKRPPEPDDAEEDDDYDPYDESVGDTTISKSRSGASSKGSSKPVKPPKVVKELARLTLFHGTKFKAFDQSLQAPASHMHSINEMKILKILSKKVNGPLWRLYNVDHMTRTYPAGTRVDSSNYSPLLAWSMGCQMVALNFQTPDIPLILNDGFFRQHAGCGYIRKPASVLEGGSSSNRPVLQVGIRILGGTCLPKPRGAKSGEHIDPYVEVSVHDVKGVSAVQKSSSTGVVADNGFCPSWSDKMFDFVVYNPELAVVRFGLRESDITLDEDVAYAAIPVQHLRRGYRSVQLFDRNNTRTGPFRCAALLVEITTSKTITASFQTDASHDASTSSRHA